MKSVTNIIFMTGFESRCNVVARCIELREWKRYVCLQENVNAWKNAENEEKTGRIEAKLMPITYRKLDLYWGRLSALF